jgi:hypothetical protein
MTFVDPTGRDALDNDESRRTQPQPFVTQTFAEETDR